MMRCLGNSVWRESWEFLKEFRCWSWSCSRSNDRERRIESRDSWGSGIVGHLVRSYRHLQQGAHQHSRILFWLGPCLQIHSSFLSFLSFFLWVVLRIFPHCRNSLAKRERERERERFLASEEVTDSLVSTSSLVLLEFLQTTWLSEALLLFDVLCPSD